MSPFSTSACLRQVLARVPRQTQVSSSCRLHSSSCVSSNRPPHNNNDGADERKLPTHYLLLAGAATAVGAALVYIKDNSNSNKTFNASALMPVVSAAKASKRLNDDLQLSSIKLNHRERRFIKFASVEYAGQIYMTPQDFIESVTDSEPRQRLRRRVLSQKDLEDNYNRTPPLHKGNSRMFRTIYDKGIMSYTEYLFLLSILTKPQTGFRIAFNMFDTDGNERVDKQEFLVLESIFSTARRERMQSIGGDSHQESSATIEDSLQKSHQVDTTLLVHFFGRKGNRDLRFEDFKMFMENLQTEVLEIEFNEFSKGLPTISELDFAKILLRYTHLQADEYEMYLERLIDKLQEEVGISFAEFKSFCQFLNTLEDFGIAMRMYTLAEQPISQEEFHRAVRICTGHNLSKHIVDTVFKIFDDDGDGQLSYKEFIAIMQDRLHRGFKHTARSEGWEAFKHCIKAEMKAVV